MSRAPTLEAVKAMLAQALEASAVPDLSSPAAYYFDADKLATEVMKHFGAACLTCGRVLDQGDPASTDCGGDCAACICEAEGRPLIIPFRRNVHVDANEGDEDE